MEFITKVTSKAVLDVIIKVARENKIKVCENYEQSGPETYPYFSFDSSRQAVVGRPFSFSPRKEISLEEMIQHLTLKVFSLPLNGQYTAVLDTKSKVVMVGCQEIGFNKVLELAELIKKANNI